jgi:beta-glucosidase
MANRTYRYFAGKPLYPFGHGLSYTRFTYKNFLVAKTNTDGELALSIDITNSGDRDGDEVVQFYAQEPTTAHALARESLCGFRRISLKRGETKQVTYTVPPTALRRWSPEKNAYLLHPGEWQILAGSSSSDIREKAPIKF